MSRGGAVSVFPPPLEARSVGGFGESAAFCVRQGAKQGMQEPEAVNVSSDINAAVWTMGDDFAHHPSVVGVAVAQVVHLPTEPGNRRVRDGPMPFRVSEY